MIKLNENITICDLIEQYATEIPDKTAVLFENQKISFRELNDKAAIFSNYLRTEIIKDQLSPLIALYLDRSISTLIAILGVLKAGAAYIPIDPAYPEARVKFILNDTQTKTLISQTHLIEKVAEFSSEYQQIKHIINIDNIAQQTLPNNIINVPLCQTDLAYIIYTSGTTGQPKGVMVDHKGLLEFVYKNNFIDYSLINIVAGASNYAFDGSCFDFFFTLANGFTLTLLDQNTLFDIDKLFLNFKQYGVDTVFLTTALFNALVSHPDIKTLTLKQLLFGGEAADIRTINKFLQINPNTRLIHVYGPTETIVFATYYDFNPNIQYENAPIGRALANKSLYILNERLTPVAKGEVGELYIGGAGLARGYWNNPALTAERFLNNTFASAQDLANGYTKIYKTGDLVRWLPDGYLEYCSRIDSQIKLRGYRIEIGEIEKALLAIPGVNNTVVLMKERIKNQSNSRYLIGYYESTQQIEESTLIQELGYFLPQYMIPSVFIHCSQFPLNPNGKVDRKLLMQLELTIQQTNTYCKPENDFENELSIIWSEVLGYSQIGRNDNFFKLGGNSILAIHLANTIRTKSNINISAIDIFKHPTIAQLATLNHAKVIVIPTPNMTKAPLSFAQERMLFAHKLAPQTCLYNIPYIFELSQSINIEQIKIAIQNIITRHNVLRSIYYYAEQSAEYIQEVKDLPLPFHEKEVANETELDLQFNNSIEQKFDLEQGYPLAITFIKFREAYFLVIVAHHIAFDGWSAALFFNELEHFYGLLNKWQDLPVISSEPLQYIDYAKWHRQSLEESNDQNLKLIDFWKNSLKDFQNLAFPLDYSRTNNNYHGEDFYFTIPEELVQKVKELAKQQQTTIYATLLATFFILLHKYTDQDDLIIGTPVANRDHPQLANTIGFLVNSLPLRLRMNGNLTFTELLTQLNSLLLEVQKYQDMPFEKIAEALEVPKDLTMHPIFQIMFGVQSFTSDINQKLFKSRLCEGYNKHAKFDLSFFIDDSQATFKGMINFSKMLLSKATIERLSIHFLNLLTKICHKQDLPIHQLTILTQNENHQIVNEWNSHYLEQKTNHSILTVFVEIVSRHPNAIAVIDGTNILSYQNLYARVCQLSAKLQQHYFANYGQTIPAETVIATYSSRNGDWLSGMLAIMQIGATYLALDINEPIERINYKLSDSNAKLIMASQPAQEKLAEFNFNCPRIDFYLETNLEEHSFPAISPHSLAYIIYTSGSTGNPKGVQIEHYGVVELAKLQGKTLKIKVGTRSLQFANSIFDASMYEVFISLLNAGTLYLLPEKIKNSPSEIINFIETYQIEVATLPPALLENLPETNSSSLRFLVTAGDVCSKKTMNFYANCLDLINAYGPSETTVCASYSLHNDQKKNTNIGKALSNKTIFILDRGLNPVPIGVIGELYIGGNGLARGYLNRPDLTAAAFIPNPFQTEDQARLDLNSKLYKTGDMAKWLADGTIEFVGRRDFQVKLNGFRIELGEIEQKLISYPSITNCKAVVQPIANQKQLCVYYTSYAMLKEEEIIAFLNRILPAYMIPNYFIQLDSLSTNSSGKIETKLLPLPQEYNPQPQTLLATNSIEEKILAIWGAVLGQAVTTVNKSFFNLGGNSIRLLKVQHHLKQQFDLEITISDLFKYVTVTQLATYIKNGGKIQESRAKVQSSPLHHQEDIAIIGMSGVFSGGVDIEKYWEAILNGHETYTVLTADAAVAQGVPPDVAFDPAYRATNTIIAEADKFDPVFFKTAPREAQLINPEIRLFAEYAWKALEDAACLDMRETHSIGIFAGTSDNSYLINNVLANAEAIADVGHWEAYMLASKDFLATRVANWCNLHGPAINVYTACSTSLTAIIEACKSLHTGSCDIVIAGGARLNFPGNFGYIYDEMSIFSNDGHCRPFDNSASGTIPGDGVGAIVLKPLSAAIRDKDNIYAIIKGYAINNDGNRKADFTAPSVDGQKECILKAQQMAGVTSDQIGYVEAHGTGTKLGDPIEFQALKEAFQANQKGHTNPNKVCYLGSVKANIGHSDVAAGIASTIKVCMMLQNRTIPPQTNFNSINEQIKLGETPFMVTTVARSWEPNSEIGLIGAVSSYGFGGTNGHLILANADSEDQTKTQHQSTLQIFCVSAKTKKALKLQIEGLINWINNHPIASLPDIAYSLNSGRESFNFRCLIVATDRTELLSKLQELVNNVHLYYYVNNKINKIAFLCTGQGSQYINMAKDLYIENSEFKHILDTCAEHLQPKLGYNLIDIIYPDLANQTQIEELLNNTRFTQISLFVIEYAIAKLWMSWGVQPDVLTGHSLGEYVAACLAGVFSLEEALDIVLIRGQLMSIMEPGAMLSVMLAEAEIRPLLGEKLSIAAINDELSCVVAGNYTEIEVLQNKLDELDVRYKRLRTSHAFHSKMMIPMLSTFREELSKLQLNPPQIPFISNSTGKYITAEEATSVDYWVNHIIEPVFFAKGLEVILREDSLIAIEVGPGDVLSQMLVAHPHRETKHYTISSLPPHKDMTINSNNFLIHSLGKLWLSSYGINFRKYYKHGRRIKLFYTYQFDNQRYWVNPDINQFNPILRKAPKKNTGLQGDSAAHQETTNNNHLQRPDLSSEYSIANNEIEHNLVAIWEEVFKITPIGVEDDFYELGGSSLLATKILVRAKAKGFQFTHKDIYNNLTIFKIASCVTLETTDKTNNIANHNDLVAELTWPKTLSPLQSRYFERGLNNVNSIICDGLTAVDSSITIDKLTQAIRHLQQSHFNLGILFIKDENGQLQTTVNPSKALEVKTYQVNAAIFARDVSEIIKNNRLRLDIFNGPATFINLIECSGEKFIYFLAPHINCDRISAENLMQELVELCLGRPAELNNYQVNKYRSWLNYFKLDTAMENQQLTYWSSMLKEYKTHTKQVKILHYQMTTYSEPILTKKELALLKQKLRSDYKVPLVVPIIYCFATAMMKFNSHPYLLANFVSHGRTTPDYALDCTKIYGQFAMHVPLLLKKGDFSLNLLDNLNIVNNHLIDLTQNQFSYNQCAWGINIKSKLKNDIQENLPSMLLNYHEADNSGKTLDSRITQVYSLLNQQGELVNNSESAYIENVNFWVSEEQVILKFYYSTLHYTLDQIKQIVSATRAELLDQINL